MSKFEFGKQIGRTLQGLLTRFVLQRGRKPNNLEMILLKREAAQTGIEERKIISMVDRQPVNPNEPIMGGQNLKKEFISETDDEIIARLNKGNKESVEGLEKRNFINKMKTQYEKSVMDKTANMPGKNNSNYEPLQKSLRDSQDGLTALKIAEKKGGSLEDVTKLFEKLRIQNIKKPSSVKLTDTIKFTEDMATGGRAGYYGGGITNMIEPDLSDIGHGAEAMNARTRVMTPGSQATTSTGLSYLLGEDNDTTRVPYNKGKAVKAVVDEGRRGFMKAAGAGAAGIAALKTGLLGFADKAVPVVEKVAEAAGQTPEYFFKLVAKIKALGDNVTSKYSTKDREIVKQYKDFEMTEDISTGEIQIFKRSQSDEAIDRFGGENATEEVFMRYKPGKGQIDETTKGKTPLDEYEENTSYISNNRENTGNILDDVDGVPDDILKEVEAGSGNVPESFYTGPNAIKKADGGRITYSSGGLAAMLGE